MSEINIKSICDILRRDDGVGVKNYLIELSWILFLKIFDEIEKQNQIMGEENFLLLGTEYAWDAGVHNKEFDKNPDKLLDFVKNKLFPYLANSTNETIKIIFSNLKETHIRSGVTLKDVIEKIDKINFLNNEEDTHYLSKVYEELLLQMGTEGGWAGEYYTPRAVVKFMVNILQPDFRTNNNFKILDPFAGSGGFLVEAYKYMLEKLNPSIDELEKLNTHTLVGYEKKFEAYILGLMNLILHGVLKPHYEL